MARNPFEVLQLDPSCSPEEVVRQGARLRQRAASEADANAIRQAVQALTGSEDDRLLAALLTHPRPGYPSAALEQFAAAFRRAPTPSEEQPAPPFDAGAFGALLLATQAEGLELPARPFEFPEGGEAPEEIERQSAEALWQSLPGNPRA